jgi:Immunity protein Imm1
MNVEFFDRQNEQHPLNGSVFAQRMDLLEALNQLQGRAPFFCELLGQNGYKVLLGIGGPAGCVQYSSKDGSPPYLMAVSRDPVSLGECFEFLIGGTLTAVSTRYRLPFDTVREIAAHFQMTGERSAIVSWEEV